MYHWKKNNPLWHYFTAPPLLWILPALANQRACVCLLPSPHHTLTVWLQGKLTYDHDHLPSFLSNQVFFPIIHVRHTGEVTREGEQISVHGMILSTFPCDRRIYFVATFHSSLNENNVMYKIIIKVRSNINPFFFSCYDIMTCSDILHNSSYLTICYETIVQFYTFYIVILVKVLRRFDKDLYFVHVGQLALFIVRQRVTLYDLQRQGRWKLRLEA